MRAAAVFALALASVATAAGPEDWIGTWKGECRLTPAFQGVSEFPASLTIARTRDPERLRWALVYETAEREVRNYELVTVDAAAGRYAVDEKNGLLLDAGFADGALYTPFTIGSILVVAIYRVGGDGVMMADMPSFGATPSRETCLEGQAESCAQSYALNRAQHCRLSRVEMRKLD